MSSVEAASSHKDAEAAEAAEKLLVDSGNDDAQEDSTLRNDFIDFRKKRSRKAASRAETLPSAASTATWAPSPFFAALLYAVCSASMNFANKAVFIGFDFQATTLLLQMLFTIVVLRLLRSCNLVRFEDYDRSLGKSLALPSLMYCANIVCSLMSLGALSIPVYQVLKRMTPVACLLLAYFVLGKAPSKAVIAAIALITAGTVTMGFGDIVFDASGYALGIGSVVSQSLYLTYVQKRGFKMDMLTILYVNSINCLPILVTIMLAIGEYPRLLAFDGWENPMVYVSLSGLLVVGALLNYSLFLCTLVNSAVLTTVVGVIKAVFTTFIGFYTFGGQPFTPLLAIGVGLNTIGAIFYSIITCHRKQREAGEKQTKSELHHTAQRPTRGCEA